MDRRALRTWVEVSPSALLANLSVVTKKIHEQAKIAPVIKANAYGHGMAWAAKTLQKSQIWGFCVAYGSEALDLIGQKVQKPILVLSSWEDRELPELIRNKVRIVAWDSSAARRISQASQRVGQTALVHLKIDTGTTRIGTRTEDAANLIRSAQRDRSLILEGLFSHYADSEGDSLSFAKQQANLFTLETSQYQVPLKHMACTAATLRLPLGRTNLVRPGIGLYGLWPSQAVRQSSRLQFQPVLSWKTHVLQVKIIPVGTSVGYGRTFQAKRQMAIAMLPIGYSDGYDRRASNSSWVVIKGQHCPVIGRVSMNLTAVDVTKVQGIRPGLTVTLIGSGCSADDLAQTWRTLHYEVISRINPNIPRIPIA